MKFVTYMIPVFAALASAGKVDECAGSCISKAIESTGCAASDSECICAAESFMSTVDECGPCSQDGKDAAVKLAEDYCEGVNHSQDLVKRQFDGLYKGHPIERWFASHPEYLKNHPGWLNNHPEWAAEHNDFIKGQLGHPWAPPPGGYHPPPPPPHYPTTTSPKPTPTGYHPHPPPGYPGWPGHTTTPKPSPTVISYPNHYPGGYPGRYHGGHYGGH